MFTNKQLQEKVNTYINNITYNTQPENLYSPIKYVLALGGKRIRPVLMLMAYNLYKEDVDNIMPCAIGLETYHNFTLLHDDLMDCADMRRGMPTVHKKWDDNTAILSGDAMLILAYKLMCEHQSEHIHKALDTFTEATLGVCEGQQYDMDFESRPNVKEDEYMEMIRLKTSLLLACALKIGAQLANAKEEDTENLYIFGEKMGLAFQLQDDLLDVYGNPDVFGKKIGGDILSNKKTFMLINALNLAEGKTKEELKSWTLKKEYNPEEKIAAVTHIYNIVGIKSVCEAKIKQLFAEAIESLNKVSVEEYKKQELRNFANNLMGREL
ncbi:MAG: polyprenyl synthetase family protein [Bacteroides sp.]|nr:polyprenyl synthetase family protein [Roseburia sp.]MCM1345744.1 polyprenyl synthetase family protein [Bacteroides sp.]MCM1420161.1 polyprenyl synthetase family protein [Bacteroides sp.]